MGGSSETQNFENTMLGELGKPGLNLKRERTKAKIAEENQQLTDYLFRGSTVPQKEPTGSPEPTLQTSSSEITESITQAAQPEGYKLYRNAVHHLKRLAKKKPIASPIGMLPPPVPITPWTLPTNTRGSFEKSVGYGPVRGKQKSRFSDGDLPFNAIDLLGRWKPMALRKMTGKAKYHVPLSWGDMNLEANIQNLKPS